MQQSLKDLEAQLDKLLGKGSPYQMSDRAKAALAGVAWVITLIIGIIQVFDALELWQLGHVVLTQYVPGTRIVEQAMPYAGLGVQGLGFFFYVAFFVILADAVLLLIATPQLKDFHRHGWELVYYGLLLDLVYSFFRIFSIIGGGVGQFIVQLFFSAVLAYFLFQIRSFFSEGKVKVTVPPAKHPGKVLKEEQAHDDPKKQQ